MKTAKLSRDLKIRTSTIGACHGFERRGGPLVFLGEITGENSAYRTQQPQKIPYVSGPDGLAPFGKCILLISYRYIKLDVVTETLEKQRTKKWTLVKAKTI